MGEPRRDGGARRGLRPGCPVAGLFMHAAAAFPPAGRTGTVRAGTGPSG